jgi:2-dehydro-3-deoxygluconokinase
MERGATRIVCVGEAMVELSPHHGQWNLHYGGDTLNTALHLVRMAHNVAYLTALGGDPFAGRLRTAWGREGLHVSAVLSVPERCTGIYAIDTDEKGERSFSYWRGDSAARRMFTAPGIEAALEEARGAGLLYFSLISLAILPDEGRELLLDLARGVRERGGRFAFDSNYRPRLWKSREEAAHWRDRAASIADFGLPSLEDERALGARGDEYEVREHWQRCGCGEVALKLGDRGCMLHDGSAVEPPANLIPLDTSGAGDAFNAGYLSGRLRGLPPPEAGGIGQRLAGWTMMRQGAIPPRDAAAPYSMLSRDAGDIGMEI